MADALAARLKTPATAPGDQLWLIPSRFLSVFVRTTARRLFIPAPIFAPCAGRGGAASVSKSRPTRPGRQLAGRGLTDIWTSAPGMARRRTTSATGNAQHVSQVTASVAPAMPGRSAMPEPRLGARVDPNSSPSARRMATRRTAWRMAAACAATQPPGLCGSTRSNGNGAPPIAGRRPLRPGGLPLGNLFACAVVQRPGHDPDANRGHAQAPGDPDGEHDAGRQGQPERGER